MIDDVRTTVFSLPTAYRQDILDELTALVAELRECESLPVNGALHTQSRAVLLGANEIPTGAVGGETEHEDENELIEDSSVQPSDTLIGNVRERMRRYFEQRANAPATIAEITQGIRATRLAVQTILYKRNAGDFESAGSRSTGGPPAKLWRLTDTKTSDESEGNVLSPDCKVFPRQNTQATR